MSDRFMSVAEMAKAWMADLWRVGFYGGGRKEAGEVSYPREQFGGRLVLPVRSRTGQTLFLVLMAYPDDPRRDGRTFMRAEVRGVVPRTDRAQLAALCVLEGAELPKNKESRDERLDAIRAHLRREDGRAYAGGWSESDELSPEEEKLVAFVRLLLWSYRPDFSEGSDDGIELFVETCDRVAKVAESARLLSDYLEFGAPGKDLRPEVKDVQMAVYAAELRHFAGLDNREIARRLHLDLSTGMQARSSKQVAANRAETGTRYYVRAMGEEKWARYKDLQRRRYHLSN